MLGIFMRAAVCVVMLGAMCLSTAVAPASYEQVSAPAVVQEETQPVAVKTTVKSKVTNVTKTVKLTSDMTVEKDETLYVRDGGVLYIDTGVELTLRGKLKVAQGGELYIRGKVDAAEGSLISVSGKTKILSNGSVQLLGSFWLNATGEVKGSGKVEVLDSFSDISCKGSFKAKIKAPAPIEKDGVTYVGGVLLVNKKYDLPSDYGDGIDPAAYSAYIKLKRASGYDMPILSGYRSYSKQQQTFEYWCSIDGREVASTYSAEPGHSEHQTGLAMDITSLNQSYGQTNEGKWLAENCWKYGFIIRYPKNKTKITGYMYEPWHVRYLGASTAKLVYDSGLCLEEFLGVA